MVADAGVHCGRCKRVPYATAEAWQAASDRMPRLGISRLKDEQAKYAAERRAHAASHSGQH
eukprot:4610270-Pleurochrysis_carterae.AAC.1